MPKHGAINLYVHGNQKAFTQLLNYDERVNAGTIKYVACEQETTLIPEAGKTTTTKNKTTTSTWLS